MPETKLTLVSIGCNYKIVTTFLQLPIYDGKPVLSNQMINHLFLTRWGFVPEWGDTISIF